MNDILKNLLSMAPGLAAGLSGNSANGAAFMQGWREAELQDQQRLRQGKLDTFALEDRNLAQQDRQRNITRQDAADKAAAEGRMQQQALQSFQIPAHLAELGSVAEDPQGAQALIESAMPNVMKAFGQESMAYGMPAVEMAQRTITGRQKAEVRKFLDTVLESEHVVAHPDADPELTEGLIPPRIQQLIGKPTARLSEIQRWAEMPVGKRARRPSDEVSLQSHEKLVNGVPTTVFFDPKKGKYFDHSGQEVKADPIPPRAPSNIDGRSPAAVATFNQIASQFDRSPLTRAADRTIVLKDAAQAIREDPQNPSYQMALAYSYIQALDTYQSAVREGELQNLGALGTMWQQLLVKANQVYTTGAFMPPEVAQQIADASERLVETIESGRARKQAEFAARARASGVGDLWDQYMAGIPSSAPNPAPPPPGGTSSALPSNALPPMAPVSSRGTTRIPGTQVDSAPAGTGGRPPAAQLRERRKFGDELREWNGSRWVLVTPQ